jgi:hypothetical protein
MSEEKIYRKNILWKQAFEIVESVLKTINTAEATDDEKFGILSKLKYNAEDSLQYVSLAIGGGKEDSNDFDWRNASRYLFALQASYLLATKLGVFKADPDIVIGLDEIIVKCQDEIVGCAKREQEKRDKEIDFLASKQKLLKTLK